MRTHPVSGKEKAILGKRTTRPAHQRFRAHEVEGRKVAGREDRDLKESWATAYFHRTVQKTPYKTTPRQAIASI